jgi:hypothetical protein
LSVGKDAAIVPFEAMSSTIQTHFLKYVFLPFVNPDNGIEGKAFGLITVEQSKSLRTSIGFDAGSVVFREFLITLRSDSNGNLYGFLFEIL